MRETLQRRERKKNDSIETLHIQLERQALTVVFLLLSFSRFISRESGRGFRKPRSRQMREIKKKKKKKRSSDDLIIFDADKNQNTR